MRLRETVRKHRDPLTLTTLVLACLVSLSLSTDSLRVRPGEVGQSALALFQQSTSAVGRFLADTVTSIRELSELRRQHDDLLRQIRHYETIADDITQLQAENRRLREALAFQASLPHESLPARVIAKEPGIFFSGLTINQGRTAGVRRDSPVIASQDGVRGLVGRVSEVGLTTSVVMPIFDSNSFVAARLLRSRHEGLVSGVGITEETLTMLYVAKSARSDVAVDDIVITSGMRSIFPEGIRIATVDSIQGRPYETSLTIGLRPVVDFSRLEYVFVLTEAGQ